MNVEQLLNAMTPEVFERLNYAIETGRWLDGTPITKEQRDSCMQAVMLYQSKHNHDAQHMSVAAGGEVTFKSKSELKKQFIETEADILRVKVDN
ncbi:YeaC family protein [Vibrio rumoiensis]|uniref:YeaC family protein n=1 Tax=Vibrio rumoiensis TaxID=76258 RepID=A0ABW7IXA3_9VIBR|nr:DUF1315 family protein [Vibrio rumoiensis]